MRASEVKSRWRSTKPGITHIPFCMKAVIAYHLIPPPSFLRLRFLFPFLLLFLLFLFLFLLLCLSFYFIPLLLIIIFIFLLFSSSFLFLLLLPFLFLFFPSSPPSTPYFLPTPSILYLPSYLFLSYSSWPVLLQRRTFSFLRLLFFFILLPSSSFS